MLQPSFSCQCSQTFAFTTQTLNYFPKQDVQAQGEHLLASEQEHAKEQDQTLAQTSLSDLYQVTAVSPRPHMAFWKYQPVGQWKGPFVPSNWELLQHSTGAQGRHRADALGRCLVAWALALLAAAALFCTHSIHLKSVLTSLPGCPAHWCQNRNVLKWTEQKLSLKGRWPHFLHHRKQLQVSFSHSPEPEVAPMTRATTTEVLHSQCFQKQYSSSSCFPNIWFWGEKLFSPFTNMSVTWGHLTAQHQDSISGPEVCSLDLASLHLKPNMC